MIQCQNNRVNKVKWVGKKITESISDKSGSQNQVYYKLQISAFTLYNAQILYMSLWVLIKDAEE